MMRPASPCRRRTGWRLLGSAIALLAAAGLGACTVVSSSAITDLTSANEEARGVYYSLPMALVDVFLVVDPDRAEFRVVLGQERYVADPKQRFLMRHRPLPNYSDTIEVAVNSNSLISKVWATTEDQTDEIIVDLAKALQSLRPGGFQSSFRGNQVKLATVTIDPSEPTQVSEAVGYFNQRARVYARNFHQTNCRAEFADEPACRLYARYQRETNQLITLKVEPPALVEAVARADCGVGLCYRIKEPYLIGFTVDGVRGGGIVEIPNKAPLVEIDVRRALFVQKIQKIEFDANGFLKSAYVKKQSELLAVAKLPLNVVEAVGKSFPVRLTIQQKQFDLQQKRLGEIEARRNLAETKRGVGAGAVAGADKE